MDKNTDNNSIRNRELNLQEMELKKNRLVDIIKIITTGVVVTLIPAIINYQIQSQQVEIKRLEGEVAYLNKFSKNVVEQDDLDKRRNFVQYLATIAHSDESRERWDAYLKIVTKLAKEQGKFDSDISDKIGEYSQLREQVEIEQGKLKEARKTNSQETAEIETNISERKIELNNIQQAIIKKTDERERFIRKSKLSNNNRKNDYIVGLQTVGIEDSKRNSMNRKLEEEGYILDKITYSYDLGNNPSWFASKPTVFYYSTVSRQAAEKLAVLFETLTDKDFVVQRGAGLGVDPDKKAITFFVHYL